jgi:tetratricopeptide (TPR) repeat protein
MQRFTAFWIVTFVLGLSACASGPTALELRQAQTHRDLADLKLQRGDTSFAIRQYRAVIELNPEDAEAYFGLGEAFRRREDFGEAERHFKRAFEMDPDHQDAMFNLGAVYIQQERYPEAIALNTDLLMDPTFLRPERALVNRGWAHYKSGDLEGAREDFSEALTTNGADPHSHLNLGIVLSEQGKTLDAMLHWQRVLRLIERRPKAQYGGLAIQARFHLARAHVKLGQRDEAIEQLQLASEQGGIGEWAEKSRAYLSVLQ